MLNCLVNRVEVWQKWEERREGKIKWRVTLNKQQWQFSENTSKNASPSREIHSKSRRYHHPNTSPCVKMTSSMVVNRNGAEALLDTVWNREVEKIEPHTPAQKKRSLSQISHTGSKHPASLEATKERTLSCKVGKATWISPALHNISANTAKTGRPYSILSASIFHFIAFCRYCAFYKLKAGGNTVLSNSLGTILPTAIAHFVFVSPFGNSSSISSLFIIILFVVMICDGLSPMLLLSLFWGDANQAHVREQT